MSGSSPSDFRRPPIDRVMRPLKAFARHKLAGAGLLLIATIAALAWANSPWFRSYEKLLHTHFVVGPDGLQLEKPLILWINDALMGVFFFLVGLEIKREVVAGELKSPKKAMLPMAGALGGMVVPALMYWLMNPTGPEARGWGIPMATDIAFALGALALLGSRVPIQLKVFLTALAIVDDIGAIIVIALFYSSGISYGTLLVGGALLVLSATLNRAGVRNALVFFGIGTLVWLAFLKSGVHATLAAVLMAFTIPARNQLDSEAFATRVDQLLVRWRSLPDDGDAMLSREQQSVADDLADAVDEATAPLQRLEHALVPVASFMILPIFALANAGVRVVGGNEGLISSVTLGVVLGLLLGKPLGVFTASYFAVRFGLAELPIGIRWRQILGVGFIAGIGFTMSLFVAGLAFDNAERVAAAKAGTLLASIAAAGIGIGLLWRASIATPRVEARVDSLTAN